MPPGLAEIHAHDLPVERDIQRYLLVTVAIFERTMQRGTTQGLVDNLRRAVAGLQGLQEGSLSLWDARAALEAATFLADDEFAEADAIFERLGSSVSRLRASAPSLHSELAHRRLLSALGKGDYEDVLAAITLAEQRTAYPEKSRFTAGYRFIRGWIALERGDYAAAGELLSARTGEATLYSALGALLAGEPQRVLDMLAAQGFSSAVDGPVTAVEVDWTPIWWRATPTTCSATGRTPCARPIARSRSGGPTALVSGWPRRSADAPHSSPHDTRSTCSPKPSSWRSRPPGGP